MTATLLRASAVGKMSRRERQYAQKAAKEEEEVARTGAVKSGRLLSWRLAQEGASGVADGTASGLGSLTASGPAVTSVDGDRPLYVDVLPFASTFLSDDLDVSKLRAKCDLFVSAAKATGFIDVVAFIRGSSSEVDALWRRKKEKEVKEGICEIPGLAILLGEAFEDAGASCQFSTEGVDFLETLASHADQDGADILSVSRDLLFFKGRRYTTFRNFEVRGGERLALEAFPEDSGGGGGGVGSSSAKGGSAVKASKASSAAAASTSFELVTPPPPTVDSELNLDATLTLGIFIRPAPSPLVRDLGFNPHSTIRDLRRSLYGIATFGPSGASGGSTGRGSAVNTSMSTNSSASDVASGSGSRSGAASPMLFSSSLAMTGIREEIVTWNAETGAAVWEITEGVKPLDEKNPNASAAILEPRARAHSALTGGSGSSASSSALGGGMSPLPFQTRSPSAVRALLLGDPTAAFHEFFPEEAASHQQAVKVGSKTPLRPSDKMLLGEKNWARHVWGCGEVVAELCAIATGKRLIEVMVSMGF